VARGHFAACHFTLLANVPWEANAAPP
jgi:hypothetical protein